MERITSFVHNYWKKFLLNDPLVIDATLGNGKDTLALAQILQGKGKIFGYDIQESALRSTRALLERSLTQNELYNVFLKRSSHEFFWESKADLIVYNLGYLPGGDKKITTRAETTVKSLQSALKIVTRAISVLCYTGHEEGKHEYEALLSFFNNLSPREFTVCQHSWINRNEAPIFFWCEKHNSSKDIII